MVSNHSVVDVLLRENSFDGRFHRRWRMEMFYRDLVAEWYEVFESFNRDIVRLKRLENERVERILQRDADRWEVRAEEVNLSPAEYSKQLRLIRFELDSHWISRRLNNV